MLKDTQVKNLKPEDKPYRKLDADRLYIGVRPSGKKVWIHKFSLNKKEGLLPMENTHRSPLLKHGSIMRETEHCSQKA